jgi:Family of unknown function (DUF6130)
MRERLKHHFISMALLAVAAVASGAVVATDAVAQSVREVPRASPYAAIENEPPPKLIVDPTPLAAGLAHGLAWIQYRVENVHVVPVFGTGALNVSPRIGHLHVHMDDLPWGWVEASDNNTISVAGLPPGQHKMLVELVNTEHRVFDGCAECRRTVTFTIPETAPTAHPH